MAARRFHCLRNYVKMFAFLVVTLTFHSQVTLAGLDKWCVPGMRPVSGGVCGRHLPLVVSHLCDMLGGGGSALNKVFKRSLQRNAQGEKLRNIMLNKRDAFSFLPTKRQGLTSQSILCECCYNRCGPYELIQYCELPDPAVRKREVRTQNDLSSNDMMGDLEDSLS